MKLNLRFLYLLPLLAVLFTNPALNASVFGKEDEGGLGKIYDYGLTGLSLLAMVLWYRRLEPVMRAWFWVVVAYMLGLSMESYAGWHSWMVYPHVFAKLLVLLQVFGLYAFYRRYPPPSFGQLVLVVLPTMLLTLVFIYPEALSLSSFLETERGFSVTSAYLLLPLGLLCLNWYLIENKLLYGLVFLVCVGLIIFLQHRTVWVCTAVALAIDLPLVALRVPQARAWSSRLVVLGALGLGLGAVSGLAVVLDNPEVVRKLAKSIGDIEHPTTQGTGTFRLEQHQAYLPLVEERPLAGWRLRGFEVPILFYKPGSGEPWWPNFTGHHFHSFYLDRLFYFGYLGVAMVLLVPVLKLGRYLLRRTPLSSESAAILACTVTFLLFAISYDWPTYMYGMLGLQLALASSPLAVAAPPVPSPPQRPRRAMQTAGALPSPSY